MTAAFDDWHNDDIGRRHARELLEHWVSGACDLMLHEECLMAACECLCHSQDDRVAV